MSGAFANTTFTARIWDRIFTPGNGVGNFLYVYAFTQWPDANNVMKPRGAFIQLHHEGFDASSQTLNCDGVSAGQCKGLDRRWNWRYAESFFNPGADFGYMDAEDVSWACQGSNATSVAVVPPTNTDVNVSVNWNRIFRCMSANGLFDTPMPSGALPLLGVHWAVEATGSNNVIWASVHGMRMVKAFAPLKSDSQSTAVIPDDWQDPTTTAEIRAGFWESCLAIEECRAANLEQYLGNYRELDYKELGQPIGIPRDFPVLPDFEVDVANQ